MRDLLVCPKSRPGTVCPLDKVTAIDGEVVARQPGTGASRITYLPGARPVNSYDPSTPVNVDRSARSSLPLWFVSMKTRRLARPASPLSDFALALASLKTRPVIEPPGE